MENKLIEYLYSVEGNKVHYNKGEKDITSPGGIYRKAHPTASVFTYIDNVAKSVGVVKDSVWWDKRDIRKINSAIDLSEVTKYIEEFYKKYLAGAKLELFKGNAQIAMYSFYINSPKQAWKAVQQALIDMSMSGRLDVHVSDLSTVDGKFGGKTNRALAKVNCDDKLFSMYICSAMKTRYTTLVAARPSKFLRYLRGWDNRVNSIVSLV